MTDIGKASEHPNQNSGCGNAALDFMKKAAEARTAGDAVLGLHLFLAAYERAIANEGDTSLAVASLREAWDVACDLRERTLAEYVFERLEPYLTHDEIAACAKKLQDLALDRLEEYGISREDLEDMAESLAQDVFGGDVPFVSFEQLSFPLPALLGIGEASGSDDAGEGGADDGEAGVTDGVRASDDVAVGARTSNASDGHPETESDDAPARGASGFDEAWRDAGSADTAPNLRVSDAFNPYKELIPERSIGKSYHAATNDGSGWNAGVGLEEDAVFNARFDSMPIAQADEDGEGEGSKEVAAQGADAPARVGSNRPEIVEDASGATGETADSNSGPLAWDAVAKSIQAAVVDESTGEPRDERAEQFAARPTAETRDHGSARARNVAAAEAGHGASSAMGPGAAEDVPSGSSGSVDVVPSAGLSAPSGSAAIEKKPKEAVRPPRQVQEKTLSYANLVGYDDAIVTVHEIGLGLQRDKDFKKFIDMMNAEHGLDRMPAADTVLFRSEVPEDASHFVEATVNELGLPVLRMVMEESVQGMPVLVVMTHGNNRPRMNHQQNRFAGPGVLVIEGLDLWVVPPSPENMEGMDGMGGMGSFFMANMTRGAREAIGLIQSAVEDPDVFVLVTSSLDAEIDPFFYDVLEPITVIDIALPTEAERRAIWGEIVRDHPSIRDVDLDDLVAYTSGMSRYDIYMAAQDAIEEAYKVGIAQRKFVPVRARNIFEKLASYQPADSDAYKELEQRVIADFAQGLDNLDDLFSQG